jgi:hypothetical protein
VAEGAIAGQHNRLLMLGNPTKTNGTFYQSHHKDRGAYTTIHLRSADSILPTADPEYRARLVRKWGEHSNVVRVRADGEFPTQEDDILIAPDLTEPCTTRDHVAGVGLRKLGVDVARFGADRTAPVLRQGAVVDHIAIYARQDTMVTVGRVVSIIETWQVDEIDVDVIGLGAGVYDCLAELKNQGKITPRVVAVNVSNDPPVEPRKGEPRPRLLRDYLCLEMARWLREETPVFTADDREVCEALAGELASVKYRLDSDGCVVVEDKDSMKKRLGLSPDLADGLGCMFAPAIREVPLAFPGGVTQKNPWR